MSKSFDGILAHGCSNTHGTWHRYKYSYPTWPEVAGKLLKEKVVNIAHPGHSPQAVAYETINWCIEHGKPKRIFIGWPSANRVNQLHHLPTLDYDQVDDSLNDSHNRLFKSTFVDNMNEETGDELGLLFHQKVHAMLYVQNFCEANDIQYTYMSWDNIPWILSTDKSWQYYKCDKSKYPKQSLIDEIDKDRNVFQDWIDYENAEKKIFVWFWGQGILPHGEIDPRGFQDDHFGKEMHEVLGRAFYNFIKLNRKPDAKKKDLEKFEQSLNKFPNKNSKIFTELTLIYENMSGKNYRREINDEPFFVYD